MSFPEVSQKKGGVESIGSGVMSKEVGEEVMEKGGKRTNYVFFRSHVLAKVCQYFTYKVRYTNSSTEIPEFPISREIALELLMAANFLDC